ncbi:hypothetical protein ACA910_017569 [Epithemia clementina (nom. ined.)]
MIFQYTAAVILLISGVFASAYDIIPLATIELTMTSDVESQSDAFPAEVTARTNAFLELIFVKEYGVDFVRVTTSVVSEEMSAVISGGFIEKLDVKGTAYFEDNVSPSLEQLDSVVKQAFQTDLEVFIEILSESTDPFLETLNVVDVQVNASVSEESSPSGLSTGAVVGIAVGSALFSAGFLCLLCICCLGDPEDEEENVPSFKKTESDESGQTNGSKKASTKASDDAASDIDMECMSGIGIRLNQEHLDLQSITSQDSSKFTYNPKTDMTDGGFTFQSCYSHDGNASLMDIDISKYGGVIPEGVSDGLEVPFGQDISAIVDGKEGNYDLTEVVGLRSIATGGSLFLHGGDGLSPHERSQATVGTYGGMSTAGLSMAMSEVGIGITEDDMEPRKFPKGRTRSLEESVGGTKNQSNTGSAIGIHEDLNDLGELVAAHRKAN